MDDIGVATDFADQLGAGTGSEADAGTGRFGTTKDGVLHRLYVDVMTTDGAQKFGEYPDEVVPEVPPADEAEITAVVLDAMSGAFDLAVPLEVNLAFGDTWADAKA